MYQKNEKYLLTQIFRLFTQSDVDVGAGYVDKYMPMFKKPEARMMMSSCKHGINTSRCL